MHTRTRRAGTALLCAAALTATLAVTVPGSRAYAYGTKAKGLAGGGVALPQDAEAARLNPAGMAFVGTRADAGLAALTPDRSYAVSGGVPGTLGYSPEGTFSSKSEVSLVPNLGFNWQAGERSSLGLTAYGYGIMHTDYPGGAAVSTEQLWLLPTYAHKVGSRSALGASGIVVYHRFRANGLQAPAAFVADHNPDNFTDKGYDSALGFGAKFGVQSQVLPGLTLGASYQTKVRMGRLKKYADLLPDQGRFDSAPVLQLGLALDPARLVGVGEPEATPKSLIIFDVERTYNTEVPALTNNLAKFQHGLMTGTDSELLGGSDGAGFGWRDVTTYKVGYQFQPSEAWVFRAGASYGRQPIPPSDVSLNTNGVSIQEWRLTAGLTRKLSDRHELSASLMYSPHETESGPNAAQQALELRSQEWEIETGYAWKF